MTEQITKDVSEKADNPVIGARSLREAAKAAVERAMGIVSGGARERGANGNTDGGAGKQPASSRQRGGGADGSAADGKDEGKKASTTIRAVSGLALDGRYMREDLSEHACVGRDVAIDHVVVEAETLPEKGERVVVYLDEVGRLEGDVVRTEDDRFVLSPRLTPARRKKLLETIAWLHDRKKGKASDRRRHTRMEPRDGQSFVVLADNRRYPCEVLDISLSGAALRMAVLPAVGTYLTLGRMRGRVVRHHESGVAVEFVRLADRAGLSKSVRHL